jgi:hypothetical protein
MFHSIRPTRARWQVAPRATFFGHYPRHNSRVPHVFREDVGYRRPSLKPATGAPDLHGCPTFAPPAASVRRCHLRPHLEHVLTAALVSADQHTGWHYGYLRKSVI